MAISNRIKGYRQVRIAQDADKYVAIGAGNNVTLGGGQTGDYLEKIVAVVTNNLASSITITDGSGSAITVLPNNLNPSNQTVVIPLGISCRSNNWFIQCSAGVSALVTGVW